MTLRHLRAGAAVAAALLALTACGGGGAETASADGKVAVVASTNVWGSVVEAVGGDAVTVHSIIDDPSADPHSYESKPADVAALGKAKVVVFNGGGYDDFFTKLIGDSGAGGAKQVDAFALSGKPEGTNEHVWYDLPTVRGVAGKVAEELSAAAPDKKDAFTANVDAFNAKLDGLSAAIAKIGTDHPGSKVVVTEPVPHYLLEAAGVADATPAEFTEAIENETDVPVAALAATNDLITGKQVTALVNNTQTENSVTQQLVAKAGTAGVPVVGVTETLPEGVAGYLDWMTKQVDALSGALGKK
ncbi:metal ABC transporter solute-binding protein, Zn/Mn family [Umezawaea tangerina]|uniref:Zinc/manganese transport system substrate-binding protein n=1 Tax=Umezawaea tangerina TaxID=84725 RepID=A0A2T0TKX6_9PSEU|nr:zinc ABC transporter substrate-binding protein [Umezawaea tangerina]PRY46287.1 zinc/manganese transport system substrate-binding protein [Umezawaea tangerina]